MDYSDIKNVSVFEEHIGSEFLIEFDSAKTVAAQLIEAKALNGGGTLADAAAREPFSLLFSVEGGIDLPQRIYRVSHSVLGDIELFMVPLGNGQLESVFN